MVNKDYNNWPKEQLITEVARLRKRKKYGLVWEDKPEDVVEQCKTELPVLKEVKNKAIAKDKNGPVNILIEGDNYHALSVLNYTHKGKVDVIYIDPPYNTGNKDFKFNDHWVDKEDGYRHSKWLSFMGKRLLLAKNLLKRTGVIFISIDDNEQANLKLLCDEIFGEENTEQMIWKKNDFTDGVLKLTKRFRIEHEYILVCYKDKNFAEFNKVLQLSQVKNKYPNPDNDPRGEWISVELGASEAKSKPNSPRYYKITSPTGREWYRQWLFDEDEIGELIKDNRVYFGIDGNAGPRLKKFVNEKREKAATSILQEYGSARSGAREVEEIFGNRVFDYPKPTELILYFLRLLKNKSTTMLDFFAGSGTTGHAVLALNKEDGGNRRFILCTNNEELDHNGDKIKHRIATDVCYPRIQNVMEGYKNTKGEKIAGLGGNLKYFRTAFVGAEPTDANKGALTRQATEMLCIREDTFEPVKETTAYKVFRNGAKHTGIVFDQRALLEFKKMLAKIGRSSWSVYIFSLGDDSFEDEFEDMKQKITVSPIPEAILRVYRRLFAVK